MKVYEVIRAAIPDANESLLEHILWGRTAYPFTKLSARDLYKASSRYIRAKARGNQLCDFCDNIASEGDHLCLNCREALKQ